MLSLVALAAAVVACVLIGHTTSDVVQCVWALSAGISLAVAAAAWWPATVAAVPRPPVALDVIARVNAGANGDADAALDAAWAA